MKTTNSTVQSDDILAIRQKKKSKGSYSARQRQNVIGQLHTLARASGRATLTLHRAIQGHIESPLLEILTSGQPDECKFDPGDESWQLKIGDWATMIRELQYQTAVMARKVLLYHAREQKHGSLRPGSLFKSADLSAN